MFVQLNPDHSSYSESVSTLKFAERVSGVELGAAKSSKDSKDVRELMEQVLFYHSTYFTHWNLLKQLSFSKMSCIMRKSIRKQLSEGGKKSYRRRFFFCPW